MKKLLIIKLGAAGDVLRTTTILHLFRGWEIDWVIAKENRDLVVNDYIHTILDDVDLIDPMKTYDKVINLEDDEDYCRKNFSKIGFETILGSYIDSKGKICYTENFAEWFDMGLIGKNGIMEANRLKLNNRSSFQEIIFRALGYQFGNQAYIMPKNIPDSDLKGDIAIAMTAGDRWPIKTWYYLKDLQEDLSKDYEVSVLPQRKTILEHIADIKQHKFVISPDSLPMHIALGLGIPCAAFFTCTSPWEIHDYSLLTKIVSPKLGQYFYSREFNEDAVKCIPYREVYELILGKLRLYNIRTHAEVK